MSYVLMPSEVARLVYGYIDDLDGCKDVAKQFLETCPLLREFAEGFRCGAKYSAKINNRTLLDFLQNVPSERSDSSISQNSLQPFKEDLLIASVKDTITKTFEDAFRKKTENNSRSLSQIKEEQAELKSILKRDLLSKIREVVKDVESNIIQSFRAQNNPNSTNADLLKTPKNTQKYHGYTLQSSVNTQKFSFSPAAHSSMLSTPKRKSATPKRLLPHSSNAVQYLVPSISSTILQQNSPQISFQSNSPYTDPPSQYSQTSAFTANSSPGCTDSSELDLQTFQNQVLNDFIECSSKPEVSGHVAELINSALETFRPNNTTSFEDATNQQSMQQQQQPQLSNNIANADIQNDIHMFNHPDQMTAFLGTAANAINDDPEFNNMVDSLILHTPFKSFIPVTPSSGSTSNGSLHTPLMNFCDNLSNKENADNLDLMPVKNFTRQLESPAKNHSQSLLNSSSSASNKKASFENSLNNASAGSDDIHNVTVIESTTKHNTSTNNVENNSAYLSCNDSSSVANASLNTSKSLTNASSLRVDTSLPNEPSGGKLSQSSISKPVFLNQHLKGSSNASKKPSFSRLVAQQANIKKFMNYSGGSFDVSFGSSNRKDKSVSASNANKVSSSQERQQLTTTISKVLENASTEPPNSTVTSVQNLDFKTVSGQMISTQANIASHPTQTFIVPPGLTLWNPDTGITTNTSEQPFIVQGHYQLCDFQTQISSTRQNIYLPPSFGKNVNNQAEVMSTSSMPMFSLVNTGNSMITDNSSESVNVSRLSATNRPSILSKSSSNSPCKVPSSSGPQQLADEASTLRSQRKEPRKSILGKRSFPEDHEPGGSSSQRQTDERSLPSQANKAGVINDGRVKALMNADIDVFLQGVHKKLPNVDNRKSNQSNSNKRSSSSSEKPKKSPSIKKHQKGHRKGRK